MAFAFLIQPRQINICRLRDYLTVSGRLTSAEANAGQ
jgi:hypothetical protein